MLIRRRTSFILHTSLPYTLNTLQPVLNILRGSYTYYTLSPVRRILGGTELPRNTPRGHTDLLSLLFDDDEFQHP